MKKLAALVLALMVAGVLAATSVGSQPAATHAAPVAERVAKPLPKCLKYVKKHGKKVCVKRAKPKPKPKPKPTGGTTTTTTTTPATPAGPPIGTYTVNTSQSSTFSFDVEDGTVSGFAFGELDVTCNPGSFLTGERGVTSPTATDLAADGTFDINTPVGLVGQTGTLRIHGTVNAAGVAS